MKNLTLRLLSLAALLGFSRCLIAAPAALPPIRTVFVIALENENFSAIQGNSAAPFINSMLTPGISNAAQVSYATKYYNAGVGVHPSEPNYVWAQAGTDFGIHTDNDPSSSSHNIFTAPHLAQQFNNAGISWKDYQEDVQLSSSPLVSASGTSGTTINPYYGTGNYAYAVKHNPTAFFSDTATQNVYALSNFFADLTNNAVGRYNWITPNLYDDMHTGLPGNFIYHGTTYSGTQAGIAQGDNFLSIVIPKIMASQAYKSNGVIIIWMDESEGGDTTAYNIPEIIISPLAKGNAYASTVPMNHSSDLKTMEEIFNLPFLSNSIPAGEYNATGVGYNNVATVNDLSDLFQSPPVITVPGTLVVEATNAAGNNVAFSVTATDAKDGTLTPTVTPSSGSLFPVGTNTVTAKATNSLSLSATNTFNVIIRDTTPPVVTINGANPYTNFQNVAFVDPGATALDIVSGSVPVTTNGTVNVGTLGAYTIKYAAADTIGNSSTNSRIVQVIPLTVPANLGGALTSDKSGFNLSFTAAMGQPYRILCTGDLTRHSTNWTVVTSGIVTNNPITFTDPAAASNGFRFYRIVSP
jgi:hypothetical protein